MKNTPKPKQQRTLNIEKIIDQAIALADEGGTDALSMRKLAGALGVTAMSLYNHVADKDQLLDLMLNHVADKIQSPEIGGDWEEMMRRRAHSMRDVLLLHSWAPTLLISKITLGDAVLRDVDKTIGCLVAAGFTFAQADWAKNAIDSHVYGYTLQELNMPVQPQEYQAASAQYLPMVDKQKYPHMYEAAQQVAKGHYDGITDFSFGLELVLNGLRKWQESAKTHPIKQA